MAATAITQCQSTVRKTLKLHSGADPFHGQLIWPSCWARAHARIETPLHRRMRRPAPENFKLCTARDPPSSSAPWPNHTHSWSS